MAEPETTVAPAAPLSAPEPAWRAPAVGVASALVLFCAIMIVMMLVRFTQERSADPLNDKELIAFREKFLANPDDDAAKHAIRQKDLAVRREYFAIQWHLNSGAWLLAPATAILLVLLNLLIITRAPAPDPESLAGAAGVWRVADRRRRALAAFAVAVFVLASVAAMVFARDSASRDERVKALGVQKGSTSHYDRRPARPCVAGEGDGRKTFAFSSHLPFLPRKAAGDGSHNENRSQKGDR